MLACSIQIISRPDSQSKLQIGVARIETVSPFHFLAYPVQVIFTYSVNTSAKIGLPVIKLTACDYAFFFN